jgi:hypothetical protein
MGRDTGRCRQRVVASARGRSEIAGKLKRLRHRHAADELVIERSHRFAPLP